MTAVEQAPVPSASRPVAADERAGAPNRGGRPDWRPAEHRYGAVLLLALVLLLFVLLAPTAAWARAVGIAIEGGALLIAVATSRARPAVRRRGALAAAIIALAAVAAVASGLAPASATFALSGLIVLAIPPALVGGLLRLIRERGVTVHAVAGSLAIYLLVGLLFAWTIGFVSRVDPTPYFAGGTSGSDGQRVYFSFAVLTTTGFGDLTPATSLGRALAVLEILVGQLYLVTVIGIVVGNFGAGRRDRPAG